MQIGADQSSIFSNYVKLRLVTLVVGDDQLFVPLHLDGCFGGDVALLEVSTVLFVNILLVFFETHLNPFNDFF